MAIQETQEIRKPEFWMSEEGREARKWFETWGIVERERLGSGDESFVPKLAIGLPGGNRSSPSNVSDALIYHMEVDAFSRKFLTGRQQRLLRFIYCDGYNYETVGLVTYHMQDGSDIELGAAMTPPMQTVSETKQTVPVWSYDLDEFEAPELREVARLWGKEFHVLLHQEHLRIGKRFAQLRLWEQRS